MWINYSAAADSCLLIPGGGSICSRRSSAGAPGELYLDAPSPHSWSTEQVDARHALAYWADTVCAHFIELDIDTPQRERFQARMNQLPLGPAMLHFLDADTQTLRRTHARIARSRGPVCVLVQMRTGRLRLRHRGREALTGPGECVLMDSIEPYDIDCIGRTSALALRLPRPWLQYWLPDPASCSARTFAGPGWSTALNAALSSLDLESSRHLALPGRDVAEQLAALLALAAGPPAEEMHRMSRLDQLRLALRDRLHEPDLTPQSLARQFDISRRYVHQLFAAAHTTFGAELICLRLERAREMLRDPRLASLPIGEVAARCGFTDPSHFARRFRQQFGRAPRDLRGQPAADAAE